MKYDANILIQNISNMITNPNIDLEPIRLLITQLIKLTPITQLETLTKLRQLITIIKTKQHQSIPIIQSPVIQPVTPIIEKYEIDENDEIGEKKVPIDLKNPDFIRTIQKMFYYYKGKKYRVRINYSPALEPTITKTFVWIEIQDYKLPYSTKTQRVRITDLIIQYYDQSLFQYMGYVKLYHKEIFDLLLRLFPNKKSIFNEVRIEYGKKTKRRGGAYFYRKNLIRIQQSIKPTDLYLVIYHELLHIFYPNHKGHFIHYELQYKKTIETEPNMLPLLSTLKLDGSHPCDFHYRIELKKKEEK